MTKLLETRGLNKSFGGVWALKDLSVHQDPGETLGMIGPNGSGKTTFINAVTGHLTLDGGRFSSTEKSSEGKGPTPSRNRASSGHTSLCGCTRSCLWPKTCGLPRSPTTGAWGVPTPWTGAMFFSPELGLKHKKETAAGSLTLFEQRRLELAMRLISRPKLIMLDEPVGD